MKQLLAPNGKPSNLTPEQWKLVRTPQFKAWFGDWENDPENASKVVDENGEPLVVYHGSFNDFNIFEENKIGLTDKGWYGYGYYFSPSTEMSDLYGKSKPYFLKIKKIFNTNKENPFYLGGKEVTDNYIDKGYEGSSKTFDVSKLFHEYCVFYKFANQIKLADGSNTTFDGNNPDIRFAEGGKVEKLIEQGVVDLKMYDASTEHSKIYGFECSKPLFIQRIFVNENYRKNGIGADVFKYIDEYAKENKYDLIFGHIQQKAEPSVDAMKTILRKNGYSTIEGNNDFYKYIDHKTQFSDGGMISEVQQGDALIYKESEFLDLDSVIYVENVTENASGTLVSLSNGQRMFLPQVMDKFRLATDSEIKRSEIMGKEIFESGGKTKRTMKRIKRGGITYGKSHAEGGIPVKNESTGDMLEVEGGEGIVNKRSMASDKKVKLNGKEMTICEAVSQLNQLEGGVQFSCDDVSDRQFIEAMAKGGELERGTRTEQEHIQVLKDLYGKRITPKQATKRIAKDHLKEDSRYYSKLAKMEGKMADGGKTADNPFAEFGLRKDFKSDAISKLDKLEAINVNFCEIDKKHCSSSKGIDRKDMPQIYEEYMDKYIDFLEENGVGYQMEYDVQVDKLKPTQENISVPRIKKILTRLLNGYYTDTQGAKLNPLSRRLIATRDGYILDGHHRWASLLFLSPKNKMDVLRINADIKDLVELSKNFDLASASQFAYGGKVSVKKPNYTSTDSNDLQTAFVKRGGFPQKGVLITPIYAIEYDLTSQNYIDNKGYTDDAFEFSVGKVGLQRLNKYPSRAESNLKDFIFSKIKPNEDYSDLEQYKDDFNFYNTYGLSTSAFLAMAKKADKIYIGISSDSGAMRFYLYIPPRLQELKDGERLFDLIFDAVNSLTLNKDRDWSQISQEAKQKSKEATKAKKGFADYFSKAKDMPKVITEYDPRHSYRLKTEDEIIAQYGYNFLDVLNSSRYTLAKKSKRKLLGLKIPKKLDYIVRYLFAPIYFNHQEDVLVSLSEFYGNDFLEAYKLPKDEAIRINRTFITIDEEFVYSKNEIESYEGGKILNQEEVKNNPSITQSDIANFYKNTITFNSSSFWVNWDTEEAEMINNMLFAKDGNNFVILPEIWGWLKYVNKMLTEVNKEYFDVGTFDFLSVVLPFFYAYASSNPSIAPNRISLGYLIDDCNYMLQKEIDGVIYCASYPQIGGVRSEDEIYVIPKVLLDIGRYENMQKNRKVDNNFMAYYSGDNNMFHDQLMQSIFMLPLAKIPSVIRAYEPSDTKDAFYSLKNDIQNSRVWLKTESPFFQTENFYDYNLKCDISFLPKLALRDDKMVFNYYLKEIFTIEENENVNLAKDISFKGIPMDEMHSLLGKSIDPNLADGLQSIMIQSFRLRSESRIGTLGGGGLPYGESFIPKKLISDSNLEKQVSADGDIYFTFGENFKQNSDYTIQKLFEKKAPNYLVNYVNRACEIFQISNFAEQIDLSYWGVGNGKRLETIVLNATIAQSSLPMNRRQTFNPAKIQFSSYSSYLYCIEPILVPKDSQKLNAQVARKKSSFEQDIQALKTLMSIYKEDEIAVYSTLLQKLRETQKKQEEFLQKRYFQNDLTNLLKLYARGQEVGGQREVTQTKSGLSTPTGAPSELDIVQWKIVRSDEFKKWFGDWELAYETKNYEGVSKAINPRTAEPLVLYHGKGNMKAEATFFNLSGFPAKYLGANLSYSQWFANAYQELRVVYEFYTRVLNPLDFETLGLGEITPIEFKRLVSSLYGYDITTRLVAEDRPQKLWMIVRSNPLMLKELRDKTPYDGIIMYEDNPQDILPNGEPNSTLDFVVFQNNQIKSADNRNQTFLLESPDFRFEKGGLITKHL